MTFEQQLDLYLRARCTLLVIVTPEEDRALQAIRAVCDRPPRACLAWDAAEGLQALTPGPRPPAAADPLSALAQVEKIDGDVLFVLKDFHEHWKHPAVKRKLRNLAQRLR